MIKSDFNTVVAVGNLEVATNTPVGRTDPKTHDTGYYNLDIQYDDTQTEHRLAPKIEVGTQTEGRWQWN